MVRLPTLFSARVTPHRSLNRTGFIVLMTFIGAVSFIAGIAFLLMGAWPVFVAAAFGGLGEREPEVAIKLLTALGRELSDRLRRANRTIHELKT